MRQALSPLPKAATGGVSLGVRRHDAAFPGATCRAETRRGHVRALQDAQRGSLLIQACFQFIVASRIIQAELFAFAVEGGLVDAEDFGGGGEAGGAGQHGADVRGFEGFQ